MAGNGAERETRAWERVEAKLDRVAEELAAMARVLRAVADRTLEFGHRLDRIERRMVEELDRRIVALEGEGR